MCIALTLIASKVAQSFTTTLCNVIVNLHVCFIFVTHSKENPTPVIPETERLLKQLE